jgi:hypothetical protein
MDPVIKQRLGNSSSTDLMIILHYLTRWSFKIVSNVLLFPHLLPLSSTVSMLLHISHKQVIFQFDSNDSFFLYIKQIRKLNLRFWQSFVKCLTNTKFYKILFSWFLIISKNMFGDEISFSSSKKWKILSVSMFQYHFAKELHDYA